MTAYINTPVDAVHSGRKRRALQVLGGSCALLVIAALPTVSDWITGTPAAQARDFVEFLIAPSRVTASFSSGANALAANESAAIPDDDEAKKAAHPLEGLSTQVTVEYLRAKRLQGTELKIGYRGIKRLAQNERVVIIGVTEPDRAGDASAGTANEFHFRVHLRHAQEGWQITKVTTDD